MAVKVAGDAGVYPAPPSRTIDTMSLPVTTPASDRAQDDVLIVGAGPAGLALATALAKADLQCTVLEQSPLATLADPAEDGRDIALTHRARCVLESLGLWQRLPADEIAPLRRAEVRDGRSSVVLPFDGQRQGHEALGWLVPNHRIRAAAHGAAVASPLVRLIGEARVSELQSSDDAATLRLVDGRTFSAPLVVAADSRYSAMRHLAGIGANRLDFGRTAMVCRLLHDGEHGGVAHERFLYGHTLALLPMAGRQCSAVLTLRSDEVGRWTALDDGAFAARIQSAFGDALGRLHSAGPRHTYPLVSTYAHRFRARRVALIGDAAVGMHPVTAHGYNFGLYGVEVLARELAAARRRGEDAGSPRALQAYEQEHRRTTLPIYLGTNAVVRLFTDDRAPARLLRSAVVQVARRLPPLQALVTRQLTGAATQGPVTRAFP
jgi:ubiquinone biosynthesis UbiH/UbiF/VisC/COQ6 family hydroxylase